jgi:hypothetical protein
LACFDAVDLVNAIQALPTYADYLGNPVDRTQDALEPFAYVHMRLPEGFSKVRFYGSGIEMDNVSASEEIPAPSGNETDINGGSPPSPPDSISMHIPAEVPVDPRATQVTLPQFALAGSSNATVCYRQVRDGVGDPLLGAATIDFQTTGLTSTATAGAYQTLYGSLAQTQTNTGFVVVVKKDSSRLTSGGNIYIEVASLPTSTLPTEATCTSAVTRGVVTIKPYGLMEILRRAFVMNR